MRAQAKRSSAANRDGSVLRAAVATMLTAFAALVLAAPASASKEAINYLGSASGSGVKGGELSFPRGIAVNRTGAGPADPGDVYVVDDNNHRIQRFDKDGNFVSAWGANVANRNEVQRVTVKAADGSLNADDGTYTLSFAGSTTAPIAANASAAAFDNALDVLASIGGDANVAVTGSAGAGYTVTFTGALAGTDVPQMTANPANLAGTVAIETVENGSGGGGNDYEVCSVASACTAAIASPGNGTAAGNGVMDNPQSVAVDNDTGNVFVSDRDNRRISVYDGAGAFIASYGTNVVASGTDNGAEFQRLTVDAESGTFALSFGATAPTVTDPIAHDASAATVQAALQSLGDIGSGNVLVSGPDGGPWTVRFVGAQGNKNQPNLTTDATLLSGDDPAIAGTGPAAAAAEQVAGGGSGYEICRAGTTDVCQVGAGGTGLGQYSTGATAGAYGIAVSQADGNAAKGTIFLANTGSQRVTTYDLDGTNPSSFGTASNFASTQPRNIAVDSRGIVYASNSTAGGRIERYDSLNANGTGAVFLAPIAATVDETQTITFTNFSSNGGDRFTLTCPSGVTTSAIDFVTSPTFFAQFITDALASTCGGNFSVFASGSSATITFGGALTGTDVPTTICTPIPSPSGGFGESCAVTAESNGTAGPLLAGSTATATAGLAVDPDSDGAGADEDVLHVLRDPAFGKTVVQQVGPGNDPGLAAAPTATDDSHGAGASFAAVNGLGIDDAGGRLFVSTTNSVSGTGNGHSVYVLADPSFLQPPVSAMDEVTVKADTTATFSATVAPRGGLVSCAFQYSTDPGFAGATEVAAPGCASLPANGGAQAIGQAVSGLHPASHYFVRLRVSRPLVPNTAVTSAVKAFDTDAVPPIVSDVGAMQVTDTSARMVGTVDPRNSATGYVFEYGTTPALGSSTAPLEIGAGTAPVTVSRVVGGLKPDTTYHFRIVATNASGATPSGQRTLHTRADPLPPADPGNCANQAIRAAQSSTHLQECRAFEMVTPPDKNQGSVDQNAFAGIRTWIAFSRDGAGAAFCSTAVFGEPANQMTFQCAPYVSRRRAGGWDTTRPFPSYCKNDREGFVEGGLAPVLSPNFDRVAFAVTESAACPFAPIDPAAPEPGRNLYRGDLTSDPFEYDLLAPAGGRSEPTGGTADFGRIVYQTDTNQTPPPDSPAPGDFAKLYEWVQEGRDGCATPGGCLQLVSKDPAGNPFTTHSKLPGRLGGGGASSAPVPTAVSADGERIFFENPAAGVGNEAQGCGGSGCDLYLRAGGATTIHVSASECTVECGVDSSSPDRMVWADPSGETALFASCAKLTNASAPTTACGTNVWSTGAKLYRWDGDAPPGGRLTDVTLDNEPGDGVAPEFRRLVGASDDGEAVYFVAGRQLVAGASTTPGMKLYRWSWNGGGPGLEYLGPYVSYELTWLDSFSTTEIGNKDPNTNGKHVRVTPDGRYVLIWTKLAYDQAADRDADADLYRWGAGEGWVCVSCQLPGAPSAGDASSWQATLIDFNNLTNILDSLEPEYSISGDGKRIFFSTPDALVAQDINGQAVCPIVSNKIDIDAQGKIYACQDVYEWNDGTLTLVTTGTGSEPFVLMGATRSGNDVFFFTKQRLVGWDVDLGTDIYTARVGGGFAEPAPVPPPCEGEACRGAGSSAPPAAGAGSAVFQGPGNPKAREEKKALRCPKGKRRVARNGKARCLAKKGKRSAKKGKRSKRAAKHNRRAAR